MLRQLHGFECIYDVEYLYYIWMYCECIYYVEYLYYIVIIFEGIVLIGEIGGQAEERAAEYLIKHNSVS